MAKILLLESDERYRSLLKSILEGVHYHVEEAESRDHLLDWTKGQGPDLIILSVHLELEGNMDDWPIWQHRLPEAPVLVLFSGDAILKAKFIKSWEGTSSFKCVDQPVDPYPFLALVKAMLATPVIWHQGGQHSL